LFPPHLHVVLSSWAIRGSCSNHYFQCKIFRGFSSHLGPISCLGHASSSRGRFSALSYQFWGGNTYYALYPKSVSAQLPGIVYLTSRFPRPPGVRRVLIAEKVFQPRNFAHIIVGIHSSPHAQANSLLFACIRSLTSNRDSWSYKPDNSATQDIPVDLSDSISDVGSQDALIEDFIRRLFANFILFWKPPW
jgi:hypothetical protein